MSDVLISSDGFAAWQNGNVFPGPEIAAGNMRKAETREDYVFAALSERAVGHFVTSIGLFRKSVEVPSVSSWG